MTGGEPPRRAPERRSRLALLLACWVAVFAGEIGVHLVHHAFELAADADCAFLAAADHAPAAGPMLVAVPLPVVAPEHGPAPAFPAPAARSEPPASSRSPPTPPSSVA